MAKEKSAHKFDIELGQRILNNIDPAYNSLKGGIADFVRRTGATWETFKNLSLHYAVDGVPEDFNIPFCFDVEQTDDINVQVTNESYPVPITPRPYYTRWLHWTPRLSYFAIFTFDDDTGLFMDVQDISADDDRRVEIFIEAAYEAIVACLLCLLWEKVPAEYVQADEP